MKYADRWLLSRYFSKVLALVVGIHIAFFAENDAFAQRSSKGDISSLGFNGERDIITNEELLMPPTYNRVIAFAKEVDEEYSSIFHRIGLNPEQIKIFKIAVVNLLRLAIDDGDYRQAFLDKRKEYDDTVRALVGKNKISLFEEHPLTKRISNKVDASLWAATRDAEYEKVYTEWNIPPHEIQILKNQRPYLEFMALPLQSQREKLIQARSDYLKFLQDLVGPKNFNLYRRWELNKPAKRTFNDFKKRNPNLPLAVLSKYESTIIDMFRESKIITSRTWHGPFDVLPSPMVGRRMVGLGAQAKLKEFLDAENLFNSLIPHYSIPTALINELNSFFIEERNKIQQVILIGSESDEAATERRNSIIEEITGNAKILLEKNQNQLETD